MHRRTFLTLTGGFVATASLPGLLSGCSPSSVGDFFSFPQGVASGDPRPTSITLWTRIASRTERANLTVEVALDKEFATPVLQQDYVVTDASDHTLRVLVTDLSPDTVYYYRFRIGDEVFSPPGRTWTAPDPLLAPDISFAFASCQERRHGFYGAYRHMLADDLARPPEQQIRFVLHLGDFIYETLNDPLQTPIDSNLNPLAQPLTDSNGIERTITSLPDGDTTDTGVSYANTLADYRHLYREYLSDPDLLAARARWPFIHTWDDHEFSDDYWQTEANYRDTGDESSTDEPSQPRKVAANQAWFEYMPVNLAALEGVDEDLQQAAEFSFADVGSTPNTLIDDTGLAANDDNLRALDTLTIYRSFRFGNLVELIATDNRSYRSDHALPEDLGGNLPVFIQPRVVLPKDIINDLDAGRTANNNDPDTFLFLGGLFLNPRRNSSPGSMLGTRQKQWWKDTLQRSTARWKLWGNPVPLQRMLVNASALNAGLPDLILSGDAWDGYRTERNELMRFLLDNDIRNVVSLAGDIHAHAAGLVMDDYDSATPTAVMTEVVCAGISSTSQFAVGERLSRIENPSNLESRVRQLIAYENGGEIINNLNNTLLNGVEAAEVAAQTNSLDDIAAAANPTINSHLRYADTDAHGFGRVRVAAETMTAELMTITDINSDTEPEVLRIARFEIPYADPGSGSSISEPAITGTPPFPLR